MNNIEEKYLPIGTVVMLEGGTKRVMITGFCTVAQDDEESEEVYDYSGCMFPEGLLSSDQIAVFNHSQIKEVYHMGLVDDEEKKFKDTLKVLAAAIEKKQEENQQ